MLVLVLLLLAGAGAVLALELVPLALPLLVLLCARPTQRAHAWPRFGKVGRFLTPRELERFDIISFVGNEANKLILAGQLTIFKNNEFSRTFWRVGPDGKFFAKGKRLGAQLFHVLIGAILVHHTFAQASQRKRVERTKLLATRDARQCQRAQFSMLASKHNLIF